MDKGVGRQVSRESRGVPAHEAQQRRDDHGSRQSGGLRGSDRSPSPAREITGLSEMNSDDDRSLPSPTPGSHLRTQHSFDDDPERSGGSGYTDDQAVRFADTSYPSIMDASVRNRAKSQPHRDVAAAQALAQVQNSKAGGKRREHAYSIAGTGQGDARPGESASRGMTGRILRENGGVGAAGFPEI